MKKDPGSPSGVRRVRRLRRLTSRSSAILVRSLSGPPEGQRQVQCLLSEMPWWAVRPTTAGFRIGEDALTRSVDDDFQGVLNSVGVCINPMCK